MTFSHENRPGGFSGKICKGENCSSESGPDKPYSGFCGLPDGRATVRSAVRRADMLAIKGMETISWPSAWSNHPSTAK